MKKYVPMFSCLFKRYYVGEVDVFDTEEDAKKEAQELNYTLYDPKDVY